jgi:hypothetical protein
MLHGIVNEAVFADSMNPMVTLEERLGSALLT